MKSSVTEKKTMPKSMKNRVAWTLSRKSFIKTALAGGVVSQFPLIKVSGKTKTNNDFALSETQLKIIKSVQNILFPSDGNGPEAKEIHAADYLLRVLSDNEKDPDEVKYIKDGIAWVSETSEEVFSKHFNDLTNQEQEKLIEKISDESWGENWLSVILTFIFEALLCDPQYGGNPESIGWKWLNHYPGQPRPPTTLLYPEILKTIRKS